jgi:hypothetical protein
MISRTGNVFVSWQLPRLSVELVLVLMEEEEEEEQILFPEHEEAAV